MQLKEKLGLTGRKGKSIAFGVAAIVYTILMFYFSTIPDSPDIAQPYFLNSDKLAHFVEFGLFGSLLFLTFAYADWRPWDAPLAISLAITYGIADEYRQLFVPGRTADYVDAIVNALGVIVIVGILAYFDHKRFPSPPLSPRDTDAN